MVILFTSEHIQRHTELLVNKEFSLVTTDDTSYVATWQISHMYMTLTIAWTNSIAVFLDSYDKVTVNIVDLVLSKIMNK